MTREHKLALILGFSVVLVVGVLISDHFSDATGAQLEDLTTTEIAETIASTGSDGSSQPLDRAHASRSAPATGHTGALPGGFSIDGEPESPATAIANRPVFGSGREALLNELQQTWSRAQDTIRAQTRDAVPAVSLDTGVGGPTTPTMTTRLPEPTRIATSSPWRRAPTNDAIPTKSHRVEEDESLWSIAQQHYGDGALYTELAAFNRGLVGDDNSIRAGVVLQIPPRRALTGGGSAPRARADTTISRAGSRAGSPAVAARTYTVRSGDTLGAIAQRLLGSSKRWAEIVELNGIEDPDVVPVGTPLRLPAASR